MRTRTAHIEAGYGSALVDSDLAAWFLQPQRQVTCGAFFRLRLGEEGREHFEVAFLDTRNRLIAVERLFSGTSDGAVVTPRIVIQRALALNAAAVIVAHNHPSGDPQPSSADRVITTQLKSVLQMVDVRLLDHVIVTATEAVSLAARGFSSCWLRAGVGTA